MDKTQAMTDETLRTISACPICRRHVCDIYSQPLLAYIPDFKHTGKGVKEAKRVIENHNAERLGYAK